jgi:hypothetical protein
MNTREHLLCLVVVAVVVFVTMVELLGGCGRNGGPNASAGGRVVCFGR